MNYCSTRNRAVQVSAAQAIAQGIAADGGLFTPVSLPRMEPAQLRDMMNMSYTQRAELVMGLFLPDYTAEELKACVTQAYAGHKFGGSPAPLTRLNDSVSVLELWHGPTCAFKDMALQMLPHLMTRALQKSENAGEAVILVATSGDTGKAALEGFKDVPGTRMVVFYPEHGVSNMQKLQMRTQKGGNVAVCAIEGNFDDAQTGVKQIFTDPDMVQALHENGMQFSSANSINWGRLLPQIVYYFSADCDWASEDPVRFGTPINFVVPTGNFGNILAGYYAKCMGLPVNRLICASNANNVLTDFIRTGVYDRNRLFYATESPSMDILVSSNLERLLFELTGHDSVQTAGYMNLLQKHGKYKIGAGLRNKMQSVFYGDCCTDAEARVALNSIFSKYNYLMDTHTAVACGVYQKYVRNTGDETPTVIVSTASPYKFADAVLKGIGAPVPADDFERLALLAARSGTDIPAPIAALQSKEVRFSGCCDKTEMKAKVRELLGLPR
jgi:threonine synthase